jgi:hypothetical protein
MDHVLQSYTKITIHRILSVPSFGCNDVVWMCCLLGKSSFPLCCLRNAGALSLLVDEAGFLVEPVAHRLIAGLFTNDAGLVCPLPQ